jgi:NADPH2:quinone reductase
MGIPGWMQQSSAKVLKLVEDGVLSVEINQRYGLEEVQRVHEDLEARATTGCSIITP